MPSTRTIALTATSVLAVLAAGVIGATAGSQGGDHAAESNGPSATATSRPASPGSASPRDPAGGSSPGRVTTGRPTATADTDTDTDTTYPGAGSEILPTPAGESASAGGYRLPPVSTAKPAPLLGDTLPQPAAATGRLVTGFPAALAPPRGVSVESSSVSVASHVLQAALVGRGGDPTATIAHYRTLLSARGFAERKAQGVENAPAASFRKGEDNVTITTQDGKTYVLANLRPKNAQG